MRGLTPRGARVVQSEPGDNRPLIRARDWLAHAAAAIRQEPGHE